MLAGKTLPTPPRTLKVDATETTLQEQHGTGQGGQEWEEIDIMDLAMIENKKTAGETAEKPHS